MYLVTGLRDEYANITDTWDESAMTLEKTKTDLYVSYVRVDHRMAQEHNGKATGFQASTTPPMSIEQLQRRVEELFLLNAIHAWLSSKIIVGSDCLTPIKSIIRLKNIAS